MIADIFICLGLFFATKTAKTHQNTELLIMSASCSKLICLNSSAVTENPSNQVLILRL